MSVIVLIHVEARQGKCADALQVIRKSEEMCLSTAGCTGFEALQRQDDEHRFTIIERWESTDIHTAFLDQVRVNEEYIDGMEVFTSPPDIERFNIV